MTGPIQVMVNGLKGKMATSIAQAIYTDPKGKAFCNSLHQEPDYEFDLLSLSLTGPETKANEIDGTLPNSIVSLRFLTLRFEQQRIMLIKPDERGQLPGLLTESGLIPSSIIAVDYTRPDAVNSNAELYCSLGMPFVMGTTGGDRPKLEETVKNSKIPAVIAPNMTKQIVVFQAMMQYAAETFPGAFRGYRLKIRESHQTGKADTSGTAKAMVQYFNQLGIPFTTDQIEMVRNPCEQMMLGVPKEALRGHGWHTYTLLSEDGNVLFQFTHNVNGREPYVSGTLDAIRFLHTKVEAGEKGLYTMINVAKGK